MQAIVLLLALGVVIAVDGQSLWSKLDGVDGQLRQLTARLTSLTSGVSDRESPVAERNVFRLTQILDRTQGEFPAKTKHLYNICTMLYQRRRWAAVVQMLHEGFVFTGLAFLKTIIIRNKFDPTCYC